MKTEITFTITQSDKKLFGHFDKIESIELEMTEEFNDLNCSAILRKIIGKLREVNYLQKREAKKNESN